MSQEKQIEEMLSIMEGEEKVTDIQVTLIVNMLANYNGDRFNEFYERYRRLEYR